MRFTSSDYHIIAALLIISIVITIGLESCAYRNDKVERKLFTQIAVNPNNRDAFNKLLLIASNEKSPKQLSALSYLSDFAALHPDQTPRLSPLVESILSVAVVDPSANRNTMFYALKILNSKPKEGEFPFEIDSKILQLLLKIAPMTYPYEVSGNMALKVLDSRETKVLCAHRESIMAFPDSSENAPESDIALNSQNIIKSLKGKVQNCNQVY